ncbi:MAG: hypothetical protein JW395_0615 [Nitrospira sp.]|nr:hypothetical protein [Nitrospira sp.]
MRDTGHHGGQRLRIGSVEGVGPEQFRDEQRVVDADEPGPFAVFGQMGRRREIAKLLENVDFFLKTVPETCAQSLDRFDVSMLFLPKFGGEGIVCLTGGPRRTGRTGKVAQSLHDGVRNRFIILWNQDGKLRQPARQLFQVME